ncbi:SET domain protein [Amanita muscaria]
MPPADSFKTWFLKHGGGSCLTYVRFDNLITPQDTKGRSIIAIKDLQPDTTIVSCPFSLVITKTLAQTALSKILDVETIIVKGSWSERQWISLYICFHWIITRERNDNVHLSHYEYVEMLPPPETLRTPLQFTPSELEAFRGTNLYGATLDRWREWQAEYAECFEAVSKTNADWAELFTWERYLTGATYLSSRAFPSSLLAPTPTLVADISTEPVLIPGLDSLNHARGAAVTWAVTYPDSDSVTNSQKESFISLVLHKPAEPNQELFNNYGPKPNSELILGYGFSLPNNPEDTILLKVAGLNGQRWSVGREAQGVEGLWDELLQSFAPESETTPGYGAQLDAAGALADMSSALLDRLPKTNEQDDMRPEVAAMLSDYVEGQRDILGSLVRFSREKEQEVILTAWEEGVVIEFGTVGPERK